MLIVGLFDENALRGSPSGVIDVRLAALGLSRVDEDIDAALRQSGVKRRFAHDVGFDWERILNPWARPAAAVEMSAIWEGQHREGLTYCALSPDTRLLAAVGLNGDVVVWDLVAGESAVIEKAHDGAILSCDLSPTGDLLATAGEDSTARLWRIAFGSERPRVSLSAVVAHDDGAVRRCPFSPDGRRLATVGDDASARLWDVRSGSLLERLDSHEAMIRHCAFRQDGRMLATAGEDGRVVLWDLAAGGDGPDVRLVSSAVTHCEFAPEGRLLATAEYDGRITLWETARQGTYTLGGHGGPAWRCRFGCGGRLLISVGSDGARVWDVLVRNPRSALELEGEAWDCAVSADGRLIAAVCEDGTVRVWDTASGASRTVLASWNEQVRACVFGADGSTLAAVGMDGHAAVWEQIAPSLLPVVAADSVGRRDLLNVGRDAVALANVIAAESTRPPLSIGLFGAWGSGKTFLIRQVQARVERLAVRARRAKTTSAYCRSIRNIEFNAWQYADANLWASLVTHIFDALARAEPAAAVATDEEARRQLLRLEETLTAQSALREQLAQAQTRADRARKLRKLTLWTLGAAEASHENVASVSSGIRALLSRGRIVAVAVTALVVGAVVGAQLGVDAVGFARPLYGAVAGLLATAGVVGAWLAKAAKMLKSADDTARLADVDRASLGAELAAADAQVRELQQELADLSSGRRLARFAAERASAGDYRAQLGLVSQIYADFYRMSRILEEQAAARSASVAAEGSPEEPARASSDLPVIDRIVLYIDDLDRCPPKRVVEVLEAVHLILALPLFVVVIAVDPRWLLQSLKLHYSAVLGMESQTDDTDETAPQQALGGAASNTDEDETSMWRSTPLNYLDKIIQVPFALRPMGRSGAAALVHGLLPVDAGEVTGDTVGGEGAATVASGSQTERAPAHGLSAPVVRPIATSAGPELTPRTLALTERERDFAVIAAAVLHTPRAVKKFTNLYRIVRARLDEPAGELERFLDTEGSDAAEFQAVLILLAVLTRFPEEAPEFLLGIGDLSQSAQRDDRSWGEYLNSLGHHKLRGCLEELTAATQRPTTTREPFRRWALEVSRYSFAAGQEVFGRYASRIVEA